MLTNSPSCSAGILTKIGKVSKRKKLSPILVKRQFNPGVHACQSKGPSVYKFSSNVTGDGYGNTDFLDEI